MKRTHLQDILASLKEMKHIIKAPEETSLHSKRAVERMLAVPADQVL